MNPQVAKAFRELYLGHRSGVLLSEADHVKRSVIFKTGAIVSARSSRPEDRLGEVMVRAGRITPQHLTDAALFIKSGRKLGETLVEFRIVSQEEVDQCVRMQLLNIACSLVIDPPQRLAFSALSEVDSVVQTPVSVADVLMESARRTSDVGAFLSSIKGETRRVGFSTDPRLRSQDVSLSPEEAFVLSRIDGTEAPAGILSVSPLSEEQTARVLWGLVEAGVIEFTGECPRQVETPRVEPEAEPEPVRARPATSPIEPEVDRVFEEYQRLDHWQVLGLDRDATLDQVKHAFNEKALRFHPDRHRQIESSIFQEKLSFVFNRVSEAFQTLSKRVEASRYEKLAEKEAQYEKQRSDWHKPAAPVQSDRPKPPEEKREPKTQDPKLVKTLFVRAKRAYDNKDYWACIQLCRQAVEISNDQAEHFHLLGLALSQNPKWRVDAEQNLKIATRLDPWKPEYFIALGELYKREGLQSRADRMFEQARAIDPTNVLLDDGLSS